MTNNQYSNLTKWTTLNINDIGMSDMGKMNNQSNYISNFKPHSIIEISITNQNKNTVVKQNVNKHN